MMPQLSVVAPAYNEESLIGEFVRRVIAALDHAGVDFEIVIVDDGSRDATFQQLSALHAADSRVRAVRLSRNFGQEAAVHAGLMHASGDAVAFCDSDLQDPPELIPDLFACWQGGARVVLARRVRRNEPWPRRMATRLFHWLFRRITAFDDKAEVGLFSLVDRGVADVLRAMPERHRYFRGMRAYVGFPHAEVHYERPVRVGAPRQSLSKLFRLAADGLFSFSYIPLRVATFLGLLTSAFAFAYLAVVLYYRLFTRAAQVGWASTLGATLLIGGVQLVSIGIIGEYLGRIYEEVKRRPGFVVQQTLGLERPSPSRPTH